MMARVRGVTACSMRESSMQNVSMRGSTGTARRRFSVIARIVAMNVFAGTITSSPSFILPISMYARMMSVSASRPFPTPMQWRHPMYCAYSRSKRATHSP